MVFELLFFFRGRAALAENKKLLSTHFSSLLSLPSSPFLLRTSKPKHNRPPPLRRGGQGRRQGLHRGAQPTTLPALAVGRRRRLCLGDAGAEARRPPLGRGPAAPPVPAKEYGSGGALLRARPVPSRLQVARRVRAVPREGSGAGERKSAGRRGRALRRTAAAAAAGSGSAAAAAAGVCVEVAEDERSSCCRSKAHLRGGRRRRRAED